MSTLTDHLRYCIGLFDLPRMTAARRETIIKAMDAAICTIIEQADLIEDLRAKLAAALGGSDD